MAPICGPCAHANDTAAFPAASPKLVDCSICRGATRLEVELYVVERILGERIRALHALGDR